MTPFTPNTPGVWFGLPAATYHAAPGFSHSMSRQMEPPARLRSYIPKPETAYMRLGTLAHHLILEPSKPLPGLVVPPEEYPAPADSSLVKAKKVAAGDPVKWSWNATYCKSWRAEQEAKGCLVLTQDELDSARGMAEAVAINPQAVELLTHGVSEVSLFAGDDESGLLLKCRTDLAPACDWLIDVKTTDEASPEAFRSKLHYEGWATQAAWYLDVWNRIADERKHFGFVMVERKAPYLVATYRVAQQDLDYARGINQRRREEYARCLMTGVWPGWTSEWETVVTPERWRVG